MNNCVFCHKTCTCLPSSQSKNLYMHVAFLSHLDIMNMTVDRQFRALLPFLCSHFFGVVGLGGLQDVVIFSCHSLSLCIIIQLHACNWTACAVQNASNCSCVVLLHVYSTHLKVHAHAVYVCAYRVYMSSF